MITDNIITVKNDWLASIPFFYNKNKGVVSTFYNAVIDSFEIDKIGCDAFFRYGYSFYGTTPFKDVNFLQPNSILEISSNNINIIQNARFEGNINDFIHNKVTADDIVDEIKAYLSNKMEDNEKKILPLSGGLDSRLLAGIIGNKNVYAFTYSGNKRNYESVNASIIAKRLNIPWQRIPLTKFYELMEQWVDIYGASEHAHGMYHIDFYRKICDSGSYDLLLSGIFADIWAGNNSVNIGGVKDIQKLGYSHGLNLSSELFDNLSIEKYSFSLENLYLSELRQQNLLSFDALNRIQMKIILISYLMTLPRFFGLKTITPFLNKRIAVKMLSLSKEQRLNRKWQKDILATMGLQINSSWNPFSVNYVNNLDIISYKKSNFDKIKSIMSSTDTDCLFKNSHNLTNIFENVGKLTPLQEVNMYLNSTRGINRIMKLFGMESSKLRNLRDLQVLFPLLYLKSISEKIEL